MGIGAVVCAFFLPPIMVWIVMVLLAASAQLEFYALMKHKDMPSFKRTGTAVGIALISSTFLMHGPFARVSETARIDEAVLILGIIAVFARQLCQKDKGRPIAAIGVTLLGILYVPFLMNFITRLAIEWDQGESSLHLDRGSQILVFYAIAIIKLSDVGAYFTGRAFGRHKLSPRFSPNKTWEGLLGGIVFSLVASVGYCLFFKESLGVIPFPLKHAVILGIVLPLAGVMGDISESLLKRASEVKDSSSLVPGVGGILDVLDSLLFGMPVFYLYVVFVLN